MGKFGIGARVRDEDGDEGVIVGKRKGERQVSYGDGWIGDVWWPKDMLTPIAANDDEPAAEREPMFKVGDRVKLLYGADEGRPAGSVGTVKEIWESKNGATVQFDAPFKGWGDCGRCWNAPWGFLAAAEWQPKVGDRVRFKEDYCGTPLGSVGDVLMIEEAAESTDGFLVGVGLANGGTQFVFSRRLEPLPVAAEAQGAGGLRIVAGRYYRTRDGRKVGPMRKSAWRNSFFSGNPEVSSQDWFEDGTFIKGYPSCLDLVAEWVDEPAAQTADPVAVASATATPAGKFKVGDRVRSVSDECVDITIGNVYVVTGIESGGMIEFLDDGGDDRVRVADGYELVEPADTPASAGTPATEITAGSLVTLGTPAIVTGIDRSHAHLQLASGGSYTLPVAALVPAA